MVSTYVLNPYIDHITVNVKRFIEKEDVSITTYVPNEIDPLQQKLNTFYELCIMLLTGL